ncbi:MAG: galactokinase [Pseudomonadota bacterium]
MTDRSIAEIHMAEFDVPNAQAYAPGRVNLIGEYTDFNDGLVLPMPLDLGVSIALSKRDDGKFVAQSASFEGQVTRQIDEKASGHWTDYLLGSVQYSGAGSEGVSISVSTTLPVGASVSSSAAVEVAVLRAMRRAYNLDYSDKALARIAQRVENEYVGVGSGLMDQMVISVGEPRKALFFDTQSGATKNYDMLRDTVLLTLHSGITRKLTENAYNDRRASCERAAADMGVESLREATADMLLHVKDQDDRRKAGHVVAENDRVLACLGALEAGDAAGFGAIMYDGHESLSTDFEVSKPEMDAMIEAARGAGALGARMTGAGFGGCIVVLSRPDQVDGLKAKIVDEFPASWLVSEQVF